MTESNIVIYQSLVNSEVHSTNDDALLSLRTEDLIEVDPTKPDDIGCSRDSFTNTGFLVITNQIIINYIVFLIIFNHSKLYFCSKSYFNLLKNVFY